MAEQLEVLVDSFDGRSLIEASAGTGKTWTLALLYARLLLEKQLSVGQILVVTYTTAATAELRERIRARLAELLAVYEGQSDADPMLLELYRCYPDAQHVRRLRLAVHGFDEAAIFTIHGFCQRALQDAAFEAGGDFDNELSHDDSELIDAILSDLWRAELAAAEPEWASYLAKSKVTPRELRKKLRSHLGKPYLRVEPAADANPPLRLQNVWKRAQQAWLRDSQQNCDELCAQISALNANSYSVDKVRAWQKRLDAYFADFACVFSEDDPIKRLATVDLQAKTKKTAIAPISALSDALQDLSDALQEAMPKAEQRMVNLTVRMLNALEQQLPQRKREQRVLAFDDLLNRLDQALADPDSGLLLIEKLRTQYPVALIDEFQDTDPIQYSIFRKIYSEGGNLCFVGDPKQAIYGFRGADLATYLQAKQEGERTYQLGFNHRSTPEVIAALNGLFNFSGSMAAQGLDYHKVEAAPQRRAPLHLPAASRALNWVWLDASQSPETGLGKTEANALVAHDSALRIAELLGQSLRGEVYFETPDGHEPLKGGDIAVLVATHRQATMVAEQLAELGVPSVRRGKESVWSSEEAQEFEAVLRAYAEPARENLLRHALLTRLLGRSAAELLAYQQDPASWDQEREASERYHQLWQQSFMRAFRLWLDEQKVAERLLRLADGERRLTNLLHLAELIQEESERRPDLEPLLAWYAAQCSSEAQSDNSLLRLESDAERVQIVTIHTSKGLEYPLVFCPFLWDGSLLSSKAKVINCHAADGQPMVDFGSEHFPENAERARAELFAERLRLTYVALTRARCALWVHWGPVQQGPNYAAADGLHSSALAWLIEGRHIEQAAAEGTQQALDQLALQLKGLSHSAVLHHLDLLIGQNPQSMQRLELRTNGTEQAEHLERAAAPHALLQLQRGLQSAWRMGSFSALTAGMHKEAPDHDQQTLSAVQEPGEGFFAFPRGARAGVCLHAIFEDWAVDSSGLAESVTARLQEHGIDPEIWGQIATEQLQRVLETPLDGQDLSLANLQRRLPELGFTFPVARLDLPRLKRILLDPAHQLPPALAQAVQRLQFETLSGFMKGFIDLTFEYQGRWYILDYKSNWLGSKAADYQAERLEQAIAAEHYYLQYLIYLIALRRFLRQRLGEAFSDEQLGGAYYLFIRGMPEAGVYFQRPAQSLLQALDQLFQEAGQ